MQDQDKPQKKRKSKTRIWITWAVVCGVVALLLLFLLVPVFLSSGAGRRLVLAKVNKSITGRADFADLSMSWWKGIRVDEFNFADEGAGVAVNIRQISTRPHYSALLFGSLSFGETVVDEPKVQIDLTQRRVAESAVPPAPSVSHRPPVVPVDRIALKVNNGSFSLRDRGGPVAITQIDSTLNLRPPGQQTEFDVKATVAHEAGHATVQAGGRLTPDKTGWSLEGTTGEFTVEVNDLDLATVTPFLALAGLEVQPRGVVSANINSQLDDGRLTQLGGVVKGTKIDVTGGPLQQDHIGTDLLNVDLSLRTQAGLVNVEKLAVDSDWLDTQLSGVVPTSFESLSEIVQADSPHSLNGSFECNLAAAFSQMPHTLRLKEGMRVNSGTVTGTVETTVAEGKKSVGANVSLTSLAGAVAGKEIALSKPVSGEVKVSSEQSTLKFDKLAVSASFADISCAGTRDSIEYDAKVSLAKLQSELGQFVSIGSYQMAGELASVGRISSTQDKVDATGSASVKKLQLTTTDGGTAVEPSAEIDFAVAVKPDDRVVELKTVNANANLGRFAIKDSVVDWDEQGQMKLNVSANDVDLARVQPFAVILASFPRDLQLSGTLGSQFSLTSQAGKYAFATDDTRVKNLSLTSPGRPPFEQDEVSLVTDVEVNASEKTLAVKELRLISPQIKVHKGRISHEIDGDTAKLSGHLDCEYDWSAVTAVAAPYLPTNLSLKGSRKDVIEFSSEYPAQEPNQLAANLTAKAKLGFDSASYMGLHFGPTEIVPQVQKGVLTVAPFSTTVNEGQLNFACRADFKQKPLLLEVPEPMQIAKDIQLNDEMVQMLRYVNPIFTNASVKGAASFGCERLAIPLGGAPKKHLQIIGTLSAEKLEVSPGGWFRDLLSLIGQTSRGQTFSLHPTRFMLWDGYLRYDNMQIDVGDNPFNFGGVIGLDKSLNMTVTLPYTLDGETVRVGEEGAAARIAVPLKGTIDGPEVDLRKLTELMLRQQGQELLRKGLEGLLK